MPHEEYVAAVAASGEPFSQSYYDALFSQHVYGGGSSSGGGEEKRWAIGETYQTYPDGSIEIVTGVNPLNGQVTSTSHRTFKSSSGGGGDGGSTKIPPKDVTAVTQVTEGGFTYFYDQDGVLIDITQTPASAIPESEPLSAAQGKWHVITPDEAAHGAAAEALLYYNDPQLYDPIISHPNNTGKDFFRAGETVWIPALPGSQLAADIAAGPTLKIMEKEQEYARQQAAEQRQFQTEQTATQQKFTAEQNALDRAQQMAIIDKQQANQMQVLLAQQSFDASQNAMDRALRLQIVNLEQAGAMSRLLKEQEFQGSQNAIDRELKKSMQLSQFAHEITILEKQQEFTREMNKEDRMAERQRLYVDMLGRDPVRATLLALGYSGPLLPEGEVYQDLPPMSGAETQATNVETALEALFNVEELELGRQGVTGLEPAQKVAATYQQAPKSAQTLIQSAYGVGGPQTAGVSPEEFKELIMSVTPTGLIK